MGESVSAAPVSAAPVSAAPDSDAPVSDASLRVITYVKNRSAFLMRGASYTAAQNLNL